MHLELAERSVDQFPTEGIGLPEGEVDISILRGRRNVGNPDHLDAGIPLDLLYPLAYPTYYVLSQTKRNFYYAPRTHPEQR